MRKSYKFGGAGGVHRRITLVQQRRRDGRRHGGRIREHRRERRLDHAQMPQPSGWSSDAVQDYFVVQCNRYRRGVEGDYTAGVTKLTHREEGGSLECWNDVNASGGWRQTG